MKLLFKYFFGLFTLIFILSSCNYDSEEELYSDFLQECDTSNIYFSSDILPILQNNCWECHSANNAPQISGVNLEEFSTLQSLAKAGVLSGVINHEPGFVPMPDNAPKLDTCDINKIIKWISDGATNN